MQPRLKLQPFNTGLQGGEMCHHKSHRGKGSGGKPGEVREQLWCPQTSTVCSHPALVQMAVMGIKKDGKSSCLGWELGMQRFRCQMDTKMGQMLPPRTSHAPDCQLQKYPWVFCSQAHSCFLCLVWKRNCSFWPSAFRSDECCTKEYRFPFFNYSMFRLWSRCDYSDWDGLISTS